MKKRLLVGSLLVSGSLLGLLFIQEPKEGKTAQAANEETVLTQSTTSSIEESRSSTSSSSTITSSTTASSSQAQTTPTTPSSQQQSEVSKEPETPKQEPTKDTNDTPIKEATAADRAKQQEKMAEQQGAVKPEKLENHFNFSVKKNQTTTSFIKEIGADAQKIAWKEGLYGSVMIAQAILETGSGNSQLSSPPYHNLFGIKGTYKGKSVNFSTQEDKGNSELYTINAGFRQYPSYKESLEDYAELLKKGISGNVAFYQQTWKAHAATYKEATAFLTGRYATDTNYDKKLNALIDTYELTTYDEDPAAKKSKDTDTATEDSTITAKATKDKEQQADDSIETVQGGEVRSITTTGTRVMPSITQRPAAEIAGTRKVTGKEVAE